MGRTVVLPVIKILIIKGHSLRRAMPPTGDEQTQNSKPRPPTTNALASSHNNKKNTKNIP